MDRAYRYLHMFWLGLYKYIRNMSISIGVAFVPSSNRLYYYGFMHAQVATTKQSRWDCRFWMNVPPLKVCYFFLFSCLVLLSVYLLVNSIFFSFSSGFRVDFSIILVITSVFSLLLFYFSLAFHCLFRFQSI
jgi:hypothetical protein